MKEGLFSLSHQWFHRGTREILRSWQLLESGHWEHYIRWSQESDFQSQQRILQQSFLLLSVWIHSISFQQKLIPWVLCDALTLDPLPLKSDTICQFFLTYHKCTRIKHHTKNAPFTETSSRRWHFSDLENKVKVNFLEPFENYEYMQLAL